MLQIVMHIIWPREGEEGGGRERGRGGGMMEGEGGGGRGREHASCPYINTYIHCQSPSNSIPEISGTRRASSHTNHDHRVFWDRVIFKGTAAKDSVIQNYM